MSVRGAKAKIIISSTTAEAKAHRRLVEVLIDQLGKNGLEALLPAEDLYGHPLDSVGEPSRPATAPASSSRPVLTSEPAKATLDGEPVDGMGESLSTQHQAATLADLVTKAKPDFTCGDDGRDMMWIEGKDTDKPSFRLGPGCT